jgi:oligopeptide/dipeptide ABC transporter ATP-binding protein
MLVPMPSIEPAAPPIADDVPATPLAAGPAGAVLAVEDLTVSFPGGSVPVRNVSMQVSPGEIVGIVGESGSGKTLTAMAIADLLPASARLSATRFALFGEDPRRLSDAQRRRLLGRSLAVVYQDPMSAMNPALRVGRQLSEVAEVHQDMSKGPATDRAVDRLRAVRIGNPEARVRQYPHEFSGGMRQRAVIAMGLMAEPKLIVADEPTTALDVTVQQQILRLLRDVSVSGGSAAIFISHDVAVVSQLCSRVLVMYAGRVVEELDVDTLVAGPAHPYTAALVASVPTMDSDRGRPLASIPGRAPGPFDDSPGCPFAPRCPRATARCREEMPPLERRSPTHRAACWHPLEGDVIEDVAV